MERGGGVRRCPGNGRSGHGGGACPAIGEPWEWQPALKESGDGVARGARVMLGNRVLGIAGRAAWDCIENAGREKAAAGEERAVHRPCVPRQRHLHIF